MSVIERVGEALVPLARWTIRNAPSESVKRWTWSRFGWRKRGYCAATNEGIVMCGRTGDTVQGYIYFFGEWEPNISHFFKTRWRKFPDGTFIDIGANVGYYSLLAAKYLPQGRVIAIEADPDIYQLLTRNTAKNPSLRVEALQSAVLANRGEVILYEGPSDNLGSTTLLADRFSGAKQKIINGDSLPALVDASALETCYTCKIDVEGAEHGVIAGLADHLPRFPKEAAFVVEITPKLVAEPDLIHIFQIFRQHGFRTYRMSNDQSPSSYWSRVDHSAPEEFHDLPSRTTDVIFCRADLGTGEP